MIIGEVPEIDYNFKPDRSDEEPSKKSKKKKKKDKKKKKAPAYMGE